MMTAPYYLLCSLENLDENKSQIRQVCSPSGRFAQNVLSPAWIPQRALAVSIGSMARLTCPTWPTWYKAAERITTELSGVIFKEPAADADGRKLVGRLQDEYLSGNVRDKLRMAQLLRSHPGSGSMLKLWKKPSPKIWKPLKLMWLGATADLFGSVHSRLFGHLRWLRLATRIRYSFMLPGWRIAG